MWRRIFSACDLIFEFVVPYYQKNGTRKQDIISGIIDELGRPPNEWEWDLST